MLAARAVRPLLAFLALSASGCVFVPPGTSAGGLAATTGATPLVLSEPAAGSRDAVRGLFAGPVGVSRDADLRHVVIDLTLDLEGERIHGSVQSTFQSLRDGTQTLRLHGEGLDIREVVDGAGASLGVRERGPMIEITLDAPLPKGDEVTVSVRFSASPSRGYGASLMEGQTFRPQAFGSGEPDGLRHWLPVWDLPGELASVDTILRVRDDMAAFANGTLVGVEEVPGTARGERIFRWRQASPIPMASISMAAARVETFAATAGKSELYFHLPSGYDERTARRTFGETSAILDQFQRRLGMDLPFPRYDQAALRDLPARLVEGASLTLFDTDELVTEVDELDDRRERPRRLVARALARKWFGVWIAPLETPHRWLLDGLAMQLELDYEERVRGVPEVDLEWEDLRRRIVRRSADVLQGLASADEEREATAERAGWVLRVLRAQLGETAFWDLVRALAAGERGRLVTLEDLRRLGLETLGLDLGPDLAQWTARISVPRLEVRFQRRAVAGAGESLGIVVRQTQPGPLFRLEVPVEVHFADGSSMRETIVSDEEKEVLILPIAQRVVDVGVDPEGVLLAELDIEKDDASWIQQAGLARSSVERARALPALERLAGTDDRARKALVQVLLESPEPSMREQCTRSMRFESPACALALQQSAASDASPLVRRAALHALLQLFAMGSWQPGVDEIERLLILRQSESSPAALEKLDALLALLPDSDR